MAEERGEYTNDFESLSKEELISKFKELLDKKEVSEMIPLVSNIKNAFDQRVAARENELFREYKAKGGFPADFVPEKDPLDGYFQETWNIFKERRKKYKEKKKQDEKNNLEARLQVIEDLKLLIEGEHRIGKAFMEFKKLKARWESIGKAPSKKEKQLQHDYHFQVELFYYNIKINKDLKDLDLQKHLERKLELLEQIKLLLNEKKIKRVETLMRTYYDEWADIGPVPQEKKEEIVERYNELSRQVYKKIKDHYKELRKTQLKNLEVKTALCENVEAINSSEIDNHRQWQEKTKRVLDIQGQFKRAGKARPEHEKEIWKRYTGACNVFFDKKRAFYESLKKDYETNKENKLKMCEKAETLAISTDWDNTTNEIIALQREWKKAPPAHPRDESKIWKRFSTACDRFFTAKKDFHAALELQKKDYLAEKEALIKEIKALNLTGNTQADLQTITSYIESWNKIDEVPKNAMKQIYEKYTSALDALYDQIEMAQDEKEILKFKNKVERLAHTDNADQLLTKELKFLKSKLNEIETSVIQYENNLGFFAKSGKADFLKAEVEKKISKSKEEMDLWNTKIKILKKSLHKISVS